ncbi:unnamed protein product [Coffea canephora]|uniref:cellulase n=1 Tax=Coffea canephora TaxID=49390 RepID=A0A068V5X9_COFCA|nr:unnamed protein product [Coffea canephora]
MDTEGSNDVKHHERYERICINFFEGQRSRRLPSSQQIAWRSNSGLSDGSFARVDLTEGYYDARDNVKFNLLMAFTTAMLSWSTLEYGKKMGLELQSAKAAIRWATDYLLKCALATLGKLYIGVGDLNANHSCWDRLEDRSVYFVSPSNLGSDLLGETTAALVAASFKTWKRWGYVISTSLLFLLLSTIQYRGSYSDSLGSAICQFSCSHSAYKVHELLWGAGWLFKATNNVYYYNFIKSLGANAATDIFSWDKKYVKKNNYALKPHDRILSTAEKLAEQRHGIKPYKQQAEDFMCRILPNSPYSNAKASTRGLMFKLSQSNLQHVTFITFLLTTYSKNMAATRHTSNCGNLLEPITYINAALLGPLAHFAGSFNN